jgi:DDE superfamily endonuclease
VRANCWAIAEAAGHEGEKRMQALLGSYQWDWTDLRGELAALTAAWLPCDPEDLIGPGIAIDETAHLKHGDATACVAPQHATLTCLITIAGRRWLAVEETFKTGKDVLGWDQCQACTWNAICRHTALAALAPAPPGRHPQRPVRPHPAPWHRQVRSRRPRTWRTC